MINFIIIALIAAVVFAFLFFGYNFLYPGHKEIKHVVPEDPKAQAAYDKKKHSEEKKTLTLQEKIELSWNFLFTIKDKIMERFSNSDKKTMYEAGYKLLENGMKYEHDVNLSVQQDRSKVKAITKTKKKKQVLSK